MNNMISIIIPAYRESEINSVLEMQQQQNYANYEIIVIDGDVKGSTIDLIRDKSVLKFISPKGRARQMNFGADKASGNIFLFLHADSRLPINGLNKINKILSSGYEAGCFDIKFQSEKFLLREIVSRTSSFRGRITRLPYGDQAFFFTKKLFQKIGGFPEIPLMEDIAIMQKIKRFNEKIFIIPDTVITSDRRWRNEGTAYVMLRNPVLSALYLLGVSPEKLEKLYP